MVIIILFYFNLSRGGLVVVTAVGGCDWVSCADGVGWVWGCWVCVWLIWGYWVWGY